MVAGEDDHGVLPLPGAFELAQDTGELVVDLLDHGVVEGLLLLSVEGFRVPGFRLEEHVPELILLVQVAQAEVRTRHFGRIELVGVDAGRDKRRVGIVGVERQHPGLVGRPALVDELQGALGDPGRLVELGGDPVLARPQCVEIAAALAHPVGVVMPFRPVVPRRVTETPVPVAVVHAGFRALPRALEVELAHQAAVVPAVRQQFGDQGRRILEDAVAVAGVVDPAGIHARHEARPAGRADRALAIGVRKGDAIPHQPVQRRRAHMGIAERADGIESLLIRAIPENVGAQRHVAAHAPPLDLTGQAAWSLLPLRPWTHPSRLLPCPHCPCRLHLHPSRLRPSRLRPSRLRPSRLRPSPGHRRP